MANIPVNPRSKCGIRTWLCKLNFGSNQENKSFDFLSGSDLVSIKNVCMEVCSFEMFWQVPCVPYWIRFLQNNYVFTHSLFCCNSDPRFYEKHREKLVFHSASGKRKNNSSLTIYNQLDLFLLFHADSLGSYVVHSTLRWSTAWKLLSGKGNDSNSNDNPDNPNKEDC